MGERKRQKTIRKSDYSILKDRTWSNGILSYVSQIQEYKGKQELFTRQKPRELKRLIEIARIQSTESSNRIEWIVTTNPRLKQLMDDKTTPRNRDEEEILGYRNVLALVHEDYNAIPAGSDDGLSESRKLLRGISPKKTGRGWNPYSIGSGKKNALCPIGCCHLK